MPPKADPTAQADVENVAGTSDQPEATDTFVTPPPTRPTTALPPVSADSVTVNIVVSNLRNGGIKDIVSASPRSSIPSEYKWVSIDGITAPDCPKYVNELIRATYARIMRTAGATPSDVQTKAARSAAIVLASVRAGAAAALQLTKADLAPAEITGSGTKLVNGTVVAEAGAATATASATRARTMEALTAAEGDAINTLMYMGMVVPVMQGLSLMQSGHHFLPTTRNLFAGMKKQALQAGTQATREWIESLGTTFDDLAFHKACHPILMSLKRGWAKQSEMASRLKLSGHGAVAIRLPGIPSEAHAGKAAMAVIVRAKPTILGFGHTCVTTTGERYIKDVELSAEGEEEMSTVAVLRSWYEAHKPSIAFCAGIVSAMRDAAGTGRDTTLNAYSIKKAISDHPTENASGVTYARAFLRRQRDAAERGEMADPKFSM